MFVIAAFSISCHNLVINLEGFFVFVYFKFLYDSQIYLMRQIVVMSQSQGDILTTHYNLLCIQRCREFTSVKPAFCRENTN